MRRFAFVALALAAAGVAPVVPACSSRTAVLAEAGDAAIGPQQLEGQPCDPTLTKPCLAASSCFVSDCVEAADGGFFCAAILEPDACGGQTGPTQKADAGSDSSSTTTVSTCFTQLDCPLTTLADGAVAVSYVCAFSAFDGCNATGTCIIPTPPHTIDGAVEEACGCDGEPVAYVDDEYTAAPAESPTPCVVLDAGPAPDGGADAGLVDAGQPDSALAPDASEDAGASDGG